MSIYEIMGIVVFLGLFAIPVLDVMIKGATYFFRTAKYDIPDINTEAMTLNEHIKISSQDYEERVLKYKHPLTMEERLEMWKDNPSFEIVEYKQTTKE